MEDRDKMVRRKRIRRHEEFMHLKFDTLALIGKAQVTRATFSETSSCLGFFLQGQFQKQSIAPNSGGRRVIRLE